MIPFQTLLELTWNCQEAKVIPRTCVNVYVASSRTIVTQVLLQSMKGP